MTDFNDLGRKTLQINIKLSEDVKDKLDELARTHNADRSSIARKFIIEGLNKLEGAHVTGIDKQET